MSIATVSIPLERLHSTAISGVEAGIGYWAKVLEYRWHDATLEDGSTILCLDKLRVRDHLGVEPKHPTKAEYIIDDATLVRGLQILVDRYPRHAAAIFGRREDAETGDVLIQCAVFGEIVYG